MHLLIELTLYFKNVTDKDVLRKAIQDLKNKVPKDENAKKNITVSIEAIYKVMGVGFENILVGGYEIITPNFKNIEIEDVNINVNPDLIFRYFEDGLVKIGGLKFHVSKSKPFDLQQSKHIANIIRMYLQEKIAEEGEVVDNKLCWAYDVFTDRLTQADENYNVTAIEAKKLSLELVQIYNKL